MTLFVKTGRCHGGRVRSFLLRQEGADNAMAPRFALFSPAKIELAMDQQGRLYFRGPKQSGPSGSALFSENIMGENKADPDDPPMKTKLPLCFHGPKQSEPSGSALF